jgi:predicted alpha/beta superfamily hydrolase
MAFPQANIPNTEVRSLPSTMVDQEFKIYVALPFDYQTAADSYPVLYISDANWIFGTVTEIIRSLQLFQEVPQMVIVGIGYPVNDFRDTQGLRVRDLTPTKNDAWIEGLAKLTQQDFKTSGSGGADNFLKFIRDELKPFIKANYRINSEDSSILGHSFGGLFGLYALLQSPNTFNRYVLSSPSIWWNPEAAFAWEENLASEYSDLSAKVFISAGTLEEVMPVPVRGGPAKFVTNMQAMATRLQNRGYKSLTLTQHVFEDETHVSVSPGAISKGLRVVFSS